MKYVQINFVFAESAFDFFQFHFDYLKFKHDNFEHNWTYAFFAFSSFD